jgi:hypothetical protein
MDSNSDSKLQQPIAAGKARTEDIQNTVNALGAKNWFKNNVKEICQSTGIKLNPRALAVMAVEVSSEISTIANNIKAIEDTLAAKNITNEIITATAFGLSPNDTSGTEFFLRVDNQDKKTDSTSKDTKDTSSSLDWTKINDWKWVDFASNLPVSDTTKLELVPKICYVYTELSKFAGRCWLDGPEMLFPFTDEQLASPGVWITTNFHGDGSQGAGGRAHYGWDLACEKGTPFYACADGVVCGFEWGGENNVINLQHDDGITYSRYMHGDIDVQTGQHVCAGDQLGTVNTYGHSTGDHLHFECAYGTNPDSLSDSYACDPVIFYPNMADHLIEETQIPINPDA